METNQSEIKDPVLWETAKKRSGFKTSLITYLLVHALLVAIWFFTGHEYFWPMWSMLGWGTGLIFQYIGAYRKPGVLSAEKEYQKLKSKQN